ILQLQTIMGKENIFLQLTDNGLPLQKKISAQIKALSSDLDIPMVATNDCHYLDATDAKAHDVLLCVGNGKFLHEANRLKFPSEEYYFRSANEMNDLFFDYPGLLKTLLSLPTGVKS